MASRKYEAQLPVTIYCGRNSLPLSSWSLLITNAILIYLRLQFENLRSRRRLSLIPSDDHLLLDDPRVIGYLVGSPLVALAFATASDVVVIGVNDADATHFADGLKDNVMRCESFQINNVKLPLPVQLSGQPFGILRLPAIGVIVS